VGEVPVDAAGERHGRGGKISPDQARPMRHERSTSAVGVLPASAQRDWDSTR
jgi:hypothetical protein